MTLDELAKSIMDQKIVGLQVDFESEIITIELENFDLDITGDGLGMKLYPLDKPKLN